MARPIENTLAILQDAMAAHRRRADARAAGRSPFRFAAPQDRRQELVLRLLAGAEQRSRFGSRRRRRRNCCAFSAPSAPANRRRGRAARNPACDDPEWLALIESLTVHETYVMRDPAQLAFFAKYAELIARAAKASRLA